MVDNLDKRDSTNRVVSRTDPMSVLPVSSDKTILKPVLSISCSPTTVSGSRPSPSPRASSYTLPSPNSDTAKRPGMFANMKRPSFLRKRSSSIEIKDGHSASGYILNRGTSDDSVPTLKRLESTSTTSTQRPQCILEDSPFLVTPQTSPTMPSGQFLSLRACCAQCGAATDKGLDETWVPPISRQAKRKLELDEIARQIEGKVQSIDSAGVILPKGDLVVDEVELLQKRRESGGSIKSLKLDGLCQSPRLDTTIATTDSINGDRRSLGLGTPTSTTSPSAPIWLCGRSASRSSSRASSCTQKSSSTPNQDQHQPPRVDYFGRPPRSATATPDDSLSLTDAAALDAEIVHAMRAAALLEGSEASGNGNGIGNKSIQNGREGWFKGLSGNGLISV